MSNGYKWLLNLALGFGVGAGTAAMDEKASTKDILRHGLISLIPIAVAVKTQLQSPAEELKQFTAAGGK